MKKVVVTGASGFIGKALVTELLDQGFFVYAIVRNYNKMEDLLNNVNLKVIELPLEDITDLPRHINDKIDLFYHLANYAKYPEENQDYRKQLKNTEYACDAISAASNINTTKFILIGSSYQYQKNHNKYYHEERSCSIYGTARLSAQLMCETIAHNHGIQMNTVLLTNCFGVGDYSTRSTNSIIKKFLQDESPLLIEGNHKHDWVYITDFIAGLIEVGMKGKNFRTYYIGNRKLKTFKEIIMETRDVINSNIELKFGTYKDSSFIDYSMIELDALYNDTKFEIQSNFKENILKTAEWIQSNFDL
jgi:nucleoside-diphosphate-sugar epimerase